MPRRCKKILRACKRLERNRNQKKTARSQIVLSRIVAKNRQLNLDPEFVRFTDNLLSNMVTRMGIPISYMKGKKEELVAIKKTIAAKANPRFTEIFKRMREGTQRVILMAMNERLPRPETSNAEMS